ncbi:MAG: hypothetical protein VB101_09905 [Rhodospirillaceae bacterium]|nr:hypothetical protein [Rhodospirillaceae bacterium]
MDSTIASAIFGAASSLIGAALGAFGAWWAAKESTASQRKTAEKDLEERKLSAINSMMLRICELGIQYPYFEDQEFCSSFRNRCGDERIRYINYCCIIFNTINMAWHFCKNSGNKVSDIIGIDEFLSKHHVWWESDLDNFQYEWDFIQYIKNLIEELKKKNRIQ